ncbi:alpha/beta-type small acid-soluble spore protein [Paenibacillus endoradicis]|uniref:alpha/beta-type small acid-soluble spore protein n=1 Tax=Paenibacillus endoradicis TaxID=2972487 RepID=UPI00215966E7|nr:alpha/beta-type small acid-soluble spore protein [Paenibacillus endoradicis]MCR8660490.1 alpha/beta-type small acid-soluble spore protein [Paenibacillus endoradicis]
MAKRNCVVPECKAALNAMKYEIAAELGVVGAASNDFNSEFADELGGASSSEGSINWSTMSTRNVGYIGGSITKRLIQQAEQVLGQR